MPYTFDARFQQVAKLLFSQVIRLGSLGSEPLAGIKLIWIAITWLGKFETDIGG